MDNHKQRDEYFKGENDVNIYSHHWPTEAPKAVILIVHGFGEHCRRYDHVASFFNQQNFSCIGFDLYGHGQTEGLKGHVDRYELFLDLLDQVVSKSKSEYPNLPFFVYAHSMGGNIGLNYLFRRNPKINGLVVTGPWIDLAEPAPKLKVMVGRLLRNILPKMIQSSEVKEHLLSRDQSVGKAYLADPFVGSSMSNAMGIDMLAAADYLRGYNGKIHVPLLIMHGDADQIIAAQPSSDLVQRLKGDITLKLWPEFYHEIHNELGKEEVFSYTQVWMEKYI